MTRRIVQNQRSLANRAPEVDETSEDEEAGGSISGYVASIDGGSSETKWASVMLSSSSLVLESKEGLKRPSTRICFKPASTELYPAVTAPRHVCRCLGRRDKLWQLCRQLRRREHLQKLTCETGDAETIRDAVSSAEDQVEVDPIFAAACG